MSHLFPYAGRNPASLFWNPFWWLARRRGLIVTASVLCVILAALGFFGTDATRIIPWHALKPFFQPDLVMDQRMQLAREQSGNLLTLAVELMTVLITLRAFRTTAYAHAEVDIEFDAARLVSANCMRTEGTTISLDQVESLFPQSDKSGRQLIRRICDAVYADSQASRDTPREALLQRFQDDLTSRLFALDSAQQSAMQMGILGTFLGLTQSLPELSQALNGLAAATGDSHRFAGLFASLQTCFATSVVGLVCSIWIRAFLLGGVTRRIDQLQRQIELVVTDLVATCRRAVNERHFARTLDAVNRRMEGLQEDLFAQRERLRVQTETIESGLASLASGKSSLDQLMASLQTATTVSRQSVDSLSESFHQAIQSQQTILKDSLATTQQAIERLRSDIAAQTRNAESAGTRHLEEHAQAIRNEIEALTELKSQIRSDVGSVAQLLQTTARQSAGTETAFAQTASAFAQHAQQQSTLLSRLNELLPQSALATELRSVHDDLSRLTPRRTHDDVFDWFRRGGNWFAGGIRSLYQRLTRSGGST